MFVILDPFASRAVHSEQSSFAIARKLRSDFYRVRDAQCVVFNAPPIDGLGNTGGFKLQIRDRTGHGPTELEQTTAGLADALLRNQDLSDSFQVSKPISHSCLSILIARKPKLLASQ